MISLPTPVELLSNPEILAEFQKYALQFMMIKNVDRDVIAWCNEVAAEPLGASPEDISGTHSSEYYPDHFLEYHLDDLDIVNAGVARLGYLEVFTDERGRHHQIITNKWPFRYGGEDYVAICAIDITATTEAAVASSDRGRAYDLRALDTAMESFNKLGASYA